MATEDDLHGIISAHEVEPLYSYPISFETVQQVRRKFQLKETQEARKLLAKIIARDTLSQLEKFAPSAEFEYEKYKVGWLDASKYESDDKKETGLFAYVQDHIEASLKQLGTDILAVHGVAVVPGLQMDRLRPIHVYKIVVSQDVSHSGGGVVRSRGWVGEEFSTRTSGRRFNRPSTVTLRPR